MALALVMALDFGGLNFVVIATTLITAVIYALIMWTKVLQVEETAWLINKAHGFLPDKRMP